ncbi:Leukemia NUP98 fusion partner 1 [Colius striatus]|uniref:leukemia NUP98 fusion partner 1 n=1 Tax=Colius striatus TaxID=57412 RepID=UPI00052996E3|nr:leukemia NUP98 fusion partner 1 [Colius striatus]KFP27101.1 Leukemia NUP98 fusion partner 1 [Colius striatus]
MEYEEDDDISFAKWMSSFWGHNLIEEDEKEGRGHKKRQTRAFSERRASLPATLSSLHTTRLHASSKGSSSGHLRGSKEFQGDQDVKCHYHRKASRTPSADSSEARSNSVQEFAESFEKQLHLKSKRSVSLQPEGMKERRERLHLRKSKSHKRMGEKSEPRREQEEDEGSEAVPAKHNEQFPS